MDPWETQVYGVEEVLARQADGETRICLTSTTGGGKTYMAAMLIRAWREMDLTVAVYTNRRMMVSQLSKDLTSFGIRHGFRAAGRDRDDGNPVQIISIPTEAGRAGLKRRKCKACGLYVQPGVYVCECGEATPFEYLYLAKRTVIDECHVNASPQMQQIMQVVEEQGGYHVGLTATPLDIGHVYRSLVIAGMPSELRKCGALVPAIHYGPDEPDLRGKKEHFPLGEDLTEQQAVAAIMRHGIFGRVLDNFVALNPDNKPAILFAPGVRESLWFAEQLTYPHLRDEQWQHLPAIPSAHIDGTEVWMNGSFRKTSDEARDECLEAHRRGEIVCICNRYVLREGIDAPWIRHLILATIFGSLQTCLQTIGRGLRADRYPDTIARFGPKEELIIQDHGGNWWRHGSANADREWDLAFTNIMVAGLRATRLAAKKCQRCGTRLGDEPKCSACGKANEVEQQRCPECMRIIFGKRCPCGYVLPEGRSRIVVQSDGNLKEISGDIFKPRRICQAPNGVHRWIKVYFRAKNSRNRMTFRSAFALFAQENNWGFPDLSWPYMPLYDNDHYCAVADIPYDRLVPNQEPRKAKPCPEKTPLWDS